MTAMTYVKPALVQMLDSALQDLRYCVRTLRRDAGLVVFGTLIIGFGVGAGSTVFNVVSAAAAAVTFPRS